MAEDFAPQFEHETWLQLVEMKRLVTEALLWEKTEQLKEMQPFSVPALMIGLGGTGSQFLCMLEPRLVLAQEPNYPQISDFLLDTEADYPHGSRLEDINWDWRAYRVPASSHLLFSIIKELMQPSPRPLWQRRSIDPKMIVRGIIPSGDNDARSLDQLAAAEHSDWNPLKGHVLASLDDREWKIFGQSHRAKPDLIVDNFVELSDDLGLTRFDAIRDCVATIVQYQFVLILYETLVSLWMYLVTIVGKLRFRQLIQRMFQRRFGNGRRSRRLLLHHAYQTPPVLLARLPNTQGAGWRMLAQGHGSGV